MPLELLLPPWPLELELASLPELELDEPLPLDELVELADAPPAPPAPPASPPFVPIVPSFSQAPTAARANPRQSHAARPLEKAIIQASFQR